MMRSLAGVAALILALPAYAQVEVLEPGASGSSSQYRQRDSSRSTPAPQSTSSSATGELYNQVLQLQEEVRLLHGQLEEQGEQLRQLKQQRLDDYMSLDKRISAMGGGSQVPAPGDSQMPASDDSGAMAPSEEPAEAIRADAMPRPPVSRPGAPQAGEEPAYEAAYEFVRNRHFPEATKAFNDFLATFPQGAMAGNAHYWLGELYLLDGDSGNARSHFEALVYQFPDNSKLPDGMFKLGRIYHQEGDTARAKELLNRVATEYQDSGSSAPRLAREYLQQNFPSR